MKKRNLLLSFLLVFFISLSSVRAEEKLVCTKTAEVDSTVSCTFTIGEETRMIETDSTYLKIESVSGNGNTQLNDYQAIYQSSGKITFTAKKSGTAHVYVSSEDGIFGYDELEQTIKISAKTTTTTTTTKAKSDNNYLASITIDGVPLEDFSKSKTKYFIELENDVTNANIKAEAEDDNATVEINGPKTLAVGDNEYTISVTSENNTTKFYKVIVTRKDEEESSNTSIKSIKIKGYNLNFDKNSKTFYLNINEEDTELDITVTLVDKNANYEIEGNENLEDGSIIKITVTAEDGSSATYRIIIEKNKKSILPIIFIIIFAVIIIGVFTFVIIKKKKKKKKKNNKTEKSGKKIVNQKKEKDVEDVEKTIEMPTINSENSKVVSEEETEFDGVDDDMIPIDNDEEEPTRMLSYVEREELEKTRLLNGDELSSKISEELDKNLLFDYESDSQDE